MNNLILHLLGSIVVAIILPMGIVRTNGVKKATPYNSYSFIILTMILLVLLNLTGLFFLGTNFLKT
jgi:uncharacterized membrane protein